MRPYEKPASKLDLYICRLTPCSEGELTMGRDRYTIEWVRTPTRPNAGFVQSIIGRCLQEGLTFKHQRETPPPIVEAEGWNSNKIIYVRVRNLDLNSSLN